MLISASASKRATHTGFTLLEVLVVVTLLALFASLVLPLMGQRGGSDDIVVQANKLRSTLSLLSENSVFRGELLAVSLTDAGYTPKRFELDSSTFVEITGDQSLAPVTFADGLVLEWALQEGEQQISLAETMQPLVAEGESQGEEEEEDGVPQLFFFPSGETTPIRLTLRDINSDRQESFRLDPVGRIVEDAADEDDDDGTL